jgi:hypothetical protein
MCQRPSTTQPELSLRLPLELTGDQRRCRRVDGVAAEYRGHAYETSRRNQRLPSYSPKPRLGACSLAASGRRDAEVLGVVLRAAGSTK